jgi:cytochrome bd-type quinol oxidase subunit 1
MRLEGIRRLASGGTMVTAAVLIALLIAVAYERGMFGALQYGTAFAFYLAVMVLAIPLAVSVREHGWVFRRIHWLPLVFAGAYAANAISVGRGRSVLLLAVAGLVIGLLIAVFGVRTRQEQLQHQD